MRFQLVDSILERSADRIVTLKAVTAAEEYLADHFPSFPVLPGVMMLEAMVQAARLLSADPAAPRLVLAEVRNLRYGNMVRPGQTLRVTVERTAAEGGSSTYKGLGEIHGAGPDSPLAVSGRFTLRPLAADLA
jgi:3-hydroxyacyl-[acyl-carrier-protein] dehydratase